MIYGIQKSVNQEIPLSFHTDVSLFIKREDLIHESISGNKYRKLKYNVDAAVSSGHDTLLSFGGAYSNHIAAVASVGNAYGLKTIGVIRGEELSGHIETNPTLRFARSCGMSFHFITREAYRDKTNESFNDELSKTYGKFYLIPEGGTNELAVKGCEEVLKEADKMFDYICVPVGTGGTIAGLINSAGPDQKILGFPALKGNFLTEDIRKFARGTQWTLISDYHFGGYAKINLELVAFINQFKADHNIPLDPVYTGKMLFGIIDMIKGHKFPKGSKVLAIHTGGLQGISGMNAKLKKNKMPLIK